MSVKWTASTRTFSASDSLMVTLAELGVDYIFANLGSDHPPIIESWARLADEGVSMPKIVVCPHEMVALSAAHGYAQATGRMQAVLVHVDVGTQNLGGALHNALRGRVPLLLIAGASPVTLDGEMVGSRNEFIRYLQDISDQRSIVREYTKWNYDLHTGKNIDLVVKRAAQIAMSEPYGPVYIMAPREVFAEPWHELSDVARELFPLQKSALPPEAVREIAHALSTARWPLIITSYLGRNPEAVQQLVDLSERWGIPVMEAGPSYMNFPADHPLHLGYEDFIERNDALERADVVLVIDSDIPWMPQNSKRRADAKLYWIDSDPLKSTIPLWYYSGATYFQANSSIALAQLFAELKHMVGDWDSIAQRKQMIAEMSSRMRAQWRNEEGWAPGQPITPQYLSKVIRELMDDNTIIVNETISNYRTVWRHVQPHIPGAFFASGASSLGWHGGASIGVKLANPDKTVIALTGDGSFVFSVPTAVQMVSAKYNAPFLTVIYNNGGWKSPKLSTMAVYPDGSAASSNQFHVSFGGDFNLEQVARVANGTFVAQVERAEYLETTLKEALATVQAGHSAVVNVIMETL